MVTQAPPTSGPSGMTDTSRAIARDALRSTTLAKGLTSFGDFYWFVGKVFKGDNRAQVVMEFRCKDPESRKKS